MEDYEVELSDSARKAFGRVSEALRYRRPHFDGDSQFFREIPFAFHMVENPEWYEFGEGFSRDDWFNFVDAYRTCTDETIPAWHDRLIESFSRGDYQAVEDHEFMPTQCRPGHFNEKFDDIRRTPLLGVP